MTAAAEPFVPGAAVAATSRDDEFRGFYAREFADVAGYALALTSDPALADEIAQEALTAVYVRWARLATPRGYAFRVVSNLARDHWTRRRRELATWADLVAHAEPSPALDGAVWDAVRRLPAPQRDVVLLHYLYDLPLADVATAVRRPLGTVKRRLHEGRALLAAALEETR
ncbi:MAG TPA: sigma-70 family RNA polymerase sigma factor [Frankiaceae bacterium]|nr:sigma-70 family RNA polymerase sigma factor [Frankiaceae bacterium]